MTYKQLNHLQTAKLASLKANGLSVVKTEESSGPKQLPWGTPHRAVFTREKLPLKRTI